MQVGNIFFRSLIREAKKSDTTLQQKPTRRLSHPIPFTSFPLSTSADNIRGKTLREHKIQTWLSVFIWAQGLKVGMFSLLPRIRYLHLFAVFAFIHTSPQLTPSPLFTRLGSITKSKLNNSMVTDICRLMVA